MPFTYDDATVDWLAQLLSSDRLGSYRTAVARPEDTRAALELYVWNAGFAGSIFGPIHVVEVAFRNAVNERMSIIFSDTAWYTNRKFKMLAPSLVGDLVDAAGRLVRERKPVDPPHMIAALHFGFWTQLIKKGPNGNWTRQLWNAGLYAAFPHHPAARDKQRVILTEIMTLKSFRNRVAHHEPIHNKRPEQEYERLLRVAGWIDPRIAQWIEHHSRCRNLLASKPTSQPGF